MLVATADGQNGWWWTRVRRLSLHVPCAGQRDRRDPPLPDELLGCDGQRFRWPETLQPFSSTHQAMPAGAPPIPLRQLCVVGWLAHRKLSLLLFIVVVEPFPSMGSSSWY